MAMPLFNAQPAGQTVNSGQTAMFTVVAVLPAGAAGGIDYQWQRRAPAGGAWVDVAGANAAAYTTPPLAVADNGAAHRVRATNAGDTAESAEAVVTVNAEAAPATMAPVWPAGANNLVAPIAPPRVLPSTRTERVLVIALAAILIAGSGFVSWVFTSRTQEASAASAILKPAAAPKVVTCVSMCMETRVATGETPEVAGAACERICAPSPAMATAAAAPAAPRQAISAPVAVSVPAVVPSAAALSVGSAGATADCYAQLKMLGFRDQDIRGCP